LLGGLFSSNEEGLMMTQESRDLKNGRLAPCARRGEIFIVTQCYLDDQVLENIRLVQDPDLLHKMDEVNNFWK
jgi:hypothetical protein